MAISSGGESECECGGMQAHPIIRFIRLRVGKVAEIIADAGADPDSDDARDTWAIPRGFL